MRGQERLHQERLYFDHNATTPLRPAAAEALVRAFSLPGNPSSIHAEGRAARAAIERAREQVARAVGGRAQDVVFTSGATEALNTLLRPAMTPTTGPSRIERLLISATAHVAALEGHGFAPESVETISVSDSGVIDIARLGRCLTELRGDGLFAPVMVAVEAANNETGALQPIAEIAKLCDAVGAALIVDAAQIIGRAPFDLAASGAAAAVLSAHKFGGPKGVGAIVFNGERLRSERPFIAGGGQEGRRRSGTENVAGIVAMGAAIEEAAREAASLGARLDNWRSRVESAMRSAAPDLAVFADAAPRLPGVSLVAIPGLRAETLLMAFDLAGVALSSGAACSSGKVRRSHVLDAMGVAPALAEGAIRISLGWSTTDAEVERFAAIFANVIQGLSERKNRRAA
ncbi:cysteine desulfurase family protein [Terrarubrum flagellatum]|uniref:cysteine desulfurase family protein n=1 Tax=Terrirubrum flagellatum TaxID=2895980 RepID=UPI0031457027